ncbi:alpha beta hydrolase fold-3 domain-containing [Trichoderma arundinaceum]|uniref:Alpha beta hydrolase fold-3 domain-containing n=1 Tax=Trichoderma arundinaceum TaxID=490622 RepID=A0A395NJY1_TRIAR|nr:alpha beta hydrolase fold-3 domain-containing [Trichoderma arundinaceum]
MTETLPPITNLRKLLAQMEAAGVEALGPCPEHLSESWVDIDPDANGYKSRTKLVWPKASNEQASPNNTCPLVVYFYGGGFSSGSPDMVLNAARAFASCFHCVVACPSYKLIPENPFPAPLQSAWQVCAWLSDPSNLNQGPLAETGISVDTKLGFVIGGVSAGGMIGAVVGGIAAAEMAGKEDFTTGIGLSRMQSPISGLFAGLPMIVHEDMLPDRFKGALRSRVDNALVDGFNTAALRDTERNLKADYHSPWFSPLNIDLNDANIARYHPKRVFAYAGDLDPLRDDTLIYEEYLRGLGSVETRCQVLQDQNHTAWVSPLWPDSHSRLIKETTMNGMSWLLGREWNKEVDLPN